MMKWPEIPNDVTEWFRKAFAQANHKVSDYLMNAPSVRETTLDDLLVNELIPNSSPMLLQSGTIVRMDIHNIGGLRRAYRWETADIAVLAFIYRGSNLIAHKIGLLQSKRLYPENNYVDDEDPVGFKYGMNVFLNPDFSSSLHSLHTDFHFHHECRYAALTSNSEQVKQIEAHNTQAGEQIFYLFYNPPFLPTKISYPRTSRHVSNTISLGARVYSAIDVHTHLQKFSSMRSPSIGELESSEHKSNWALEEWAADLLLGCKVGTMLEQSRDEKIRNLLERRSDPIGAAIAMSITLPEQG